MDHVFWAGIVFVILLLISLWILALTNSHRKQAEKRSKCSCGHIHYHRRHHHKKNSTDDKR